MQTFSHSNFGEKKGPWHKGQASDLYHNWSFPEQECEKSKDEFWSTQKGNVVVKGE